MTSVENLYRTETHRYSASRSPTPLMLYGRPCELSTMEPSTWKWVTQDREMEQSTTE